MLQPTYPGVYIEEVPSGVRTIAGVSTSVTAFVGRTKRGPVNSPTMCFNGGEFNRRFGGLWVDRPLTYAVSDFFANGGSQALIVRLFKPKAEDDPGVAKMTVGNLNLEAVNPGEWGNKVKATVTYNADQNAVTTFAQQMSAAGTPLLATDLFDLRIEDTGTGAVENHLNVTVKEDGGSRRVDRVLAASSSLLVMQKKNDGSPDLPNPNARPPEANATGADGNDGDPLDAADYQGDEAKKTGIYALLKADIFNLLCIPPDTRVGPGKETDKAVWNTAAKFCRERRAFLIVDPPDAWDDNPDTAAATVKAAQEGGPLITLNDNAANAAIYFPQLRKRDPARDGQVDTFVPCGTVAGIMARTDASRGVWKAPAGTAATISGVEALTVKLTDDENGLLNPIAVNCLRTFRGLGRVVWGARTAKGSDALSDDYKYVPVRRLALFIEESLYRGTQWVVFEPNDEPLWAQIRMNVGAFMQRLFRQGAFQGASPREAYLVKCDSETTTQDDINRGIVNIVVGFAPLQPAEFVILQIQQIRSAS